MMASKILHAMRDLCGFTVACFFVDEPEGSFACSARRARCCLSLSRPLLGMSAHSPTAQTAHTPTRRSLRPADSLEMYHEAKREIVRWREVVVHPQAVDLTWSECANLPACVLPGHENGKKGPQAARDLKQPRFSAGNLFRRVFYYYVVVL